MVDKKGVEKTAVYEQSGPDLLAAVPAAAKETTSRPDPEWPRLRQHCEQQIASMRNWRASWWDGTWNQVARFIEPVRSTWITQTPGGYATPNNMVRGRSLNRDILDPTATFAVRIAAAGLMSGLASPSRPWFKLNPIGGEETDEAGSEWIEEVQSRMEIVMATSNFYQSFALECGDLLTFGTAPVLIYEDQRDIIRLYNPCNGEYFLSVDSTMRVTPFARTFNLTILQIIDMFGLENVPPDIQSLWKDKGAGMHQERAIGHIVEPNFALSDERGEYGKVKGPFTWREVYWMYGAATRGPLSIRGFREQPFTAGRWQWQGNDPYGRSPAMDCIGDVIQLQTMTKRKAQALEKVVNPPLLADVSLKHEPASVLPGGVTYVSGLSAQTGMRSVYQINPDLPAISADISMIQQRIKQGFFNDLFLMLSSESAPPQKTAYEVAQLMQERLQVLGPVIESLLTDSLKPKVKRIYSIMLRRNMLPPKPASLKATPIDIEFVSMLAVAQKAAATGGIQRLMALAGNLIAAFPETGDVVDADEVLREYNELLGNPGKLLRSPDQVTQIRQQKAQQAEQSQRMQMLAQGGQAAVQAAQTLSQTPLNNGSALDGILGLNNASK